jgi:hypothetical protein
MVPLTVRPVAVLSVVVVPLEEGGGVRNFSGVGSSGVGSGGKALSSVPCGIETCRKATGPGGAPRSGKGTRWLRSTRTAKRTSAPLPLAECLDGGE